jgi:hypothetical protein
MVSGTRETIKLDSKPSRLTVEVVSNGQSLTAMGATHYWALWRKAADAGGRMNAAGTVVEVCSV